MNKKIEEHRITYYTYFSVILGVVTGSLFFFILLSSNPVPVMGQGLEDYKISGVMDLPVLYLLLYVLKRRVGQLLLFIILMVLFSYSVAASCYCFFFGAYYGVILCSLFVKFGINGLIYGFMCFFPHYFIYFLMIYLVGKWFYTASPLKNYSYKNVNNLQKIIKYFVIFLAMMAAIIWEVKFQKNILNYFYQYLV